MAVFNGGDNGVYVHNGTTPRAQIEKDHSVENAAAGGTIVGETEYWDEFAKHDSRGNIVRDKNGYFANTDTENDRIWKKGINLISHIQLKNGLQIVPIDTEHFVLRML